MDELPKRKVLNKYYSRFKRQKSDDGQEQPPLQISAPDNVCGSIHNANNDQLFRFQSHILSENNITGSSDSENSDINIDIRINSANTDNHIQSLSSDLSLWAVTHNVPHTTFSDLLKILNKHHIDNISNKDARTLLKTPRNTGHAITTLEPGSYYHFGFVSSLNLLLNKSKNLLKTNILEICLNVDGLPLSKSSGSQLWPIMMNLSANKNIVEIVGVYQGFEKPKNANNFLRRFVEEATPIINNGFIYNDKKYVVKIIAFICDAPAKSFVKCTRGHSGYMSCTKCDTEGVFLNNKVCFSSSIENFNLRTDTSFRQKEQDNHHTDTSVLENLPGIDMINSFPLDYMHLVCLGVVKKLILNLWLSGKPPYKLSALTINQISSKHLEFKNQIPEEFSRKPRSLLDVRRWKATEFRLFLFYTGPVVLKDHVCYEVYQNFMSLHVAFTLLSKSCLINYAEELLKYFVKTFVKIYGREHVSHNIHNLLHIANDSRKYGSIENFSAFPFENNMMFLKKYIRKGNQPLQQIVNRIEERKNFITDEASLLEYPMLKSEHCQGPHLQNLLVIKQFKKVIFKDFLLSIEEPNNCCILKSKKIVNIKNIVLISSNNVKIFGTQYCQLTNFFETPCESSELNIFLANQESSLQAWSLSDIESKCMRLKYGNKFVIFPLLHCT